MGRDVVTTSTGDGTATVLLSSSGSDNIQIHTVNAGGQGGWVPNLQVSGGTADASKATMFGTGNLIVNGGTFIAPTATLAIDGDQFTVTSPSVFTHNSGTVKFVRGQGTTTVNIGATELNNVTLDMQNYANLAVTGTMDVNGLLWIAGAGSSKLASGTILAGGDVVTVNTGFNGGGLIKFDGARAEVQCQRQRGPGRQRRDRQVRRHAHAGRHAAARGQLDADQRHGRGRQERAGLRGRRHDH